MLEMLELGNFKVTNQKTVWSWSIDVYLGFMVIINVVPDIELVLTALIPQLLCTKQARLGPSMVLRIPCSHEHRYGLISEAESHNSNFGRLYKF